MAEATVPTQPDTAAMVAELGFPPQRLARIYVEGAIARCMKAVGEAVARLEDLDDHDRRRAIDQALMDAQHSLIEALRRCGGDR